MLKHFLRPNHAFSFVRGATVNVRSKGGKSTEELRKALAETFGYIARRTRMDIDEKMKQLSELFAKTTNELSELVKENEKFIMVEIQRVEEAVRTTSEVCARGKMDRLRDVKDDYKERIKICNDKAVVGLGAAKSMCDQRIQMADGLRSSMKQILKECLQTSEFVKCVASGTKEAVKRRKQISVELSETIKSAELSVTEQLKEAVRCHADAQAKALEELRKILKDMKDCLL